MQKKPFRALVSQSGIRNSMNTKICQRNPSTKETKRALLNILETEDSYMEPDEIMLKFKHSKIESNSTISSIFFVHLETLGLFLLYNQHLPFSFFFLRIFLPFYVIFLHFRFIFQCN